MSESIDGDISWNERLEEYFASTGEKAHCLSWIHKKSEEKYAQMRTFIDLPVIAISSVTGFLSVGSSSMFGDQMAASIALGLCSLLVSVLNTTGTYFGWAKRAEGHRISSIQYARLYRFLNIEMSLPRSERMTPADLLKHTKDQYDRLQEISPMLPPSVITEFKEKFKNETDISKPEEANGLEKIIIFGSREHGHTVASPRSETPSVRMKSLPSDTILDAPVGSLTLRSSKQPMRQMESRTETKLPSRQTPLAVAEATSPAPTERATSLSIE